MRIVSLICLCLCLLLWGAQIAQAQSIAPYLSKDVQTVKSTEVKSTALTIYPDNLALVRETRTIDVPAGVVDIQFFGVTDMVIPQSAVLEQFEGLRIESNFDSDIITPAKLLRQSVGETLTIRRLNPVTGKSDLIAAKLISAAPEIRSQTGELITAIFSTADGIEAYQCSGLPESIILSKLPEGLHSVPVLSARVASETSGPKEVTLTYMTRGLEWEADYRMDVAQEKPEASLLGWLTLKNKTSKSFKDTQLAFVAGNLNQVNDPNQFDSRTRRDRMASCVLHKYVSGDGQQTAAVFTPETAGFSAGVLYDAGGGGGDEVVVTAAKRATVREATREKLGDYKLYRAPQAVSVKAHQTKQIAFLFKENIEFETSYNWTASALRELLGDELPVQSRIVYEIDNSKGGSLAVPLPKGTLRAMSQRKDGVDVFLGEGKISNSPVGEPLKVKTADSFLVMARFYDTKDDGGKRGSAKIDITNATDTKVKAEFDFDFLETVTINHGRKRKKLSGEDKRYAFTVPAQGTVTLSFEGKVSGKYYD